MTAQSLVLLAGIALSFGCLALALSSVGGRRHEMARRADVVRRRVRAIGPAATMPAESVVVSRQSSGTPFLDIILRRIVPRQSVLRERLARTGRNIGIGGYAATCALVGCCIGFATWRLAGLQPVPAAGIGVVVGLWGPHLAVGWMIRRRLDAFVAVFPEAIELMVRGIKSGLPITECIAMVGQEMADPVGPEFRRISERVRLGSTLEDALWGTARRIDIPEFRFLVISLAVQRETGGNLAQTLANLSDVLRRRRQMALKVRAMSSEARASAMILGSLPFAMFTIIYFLNRGYAIELFTDPRGRMMLLVGLGLMSIGIFVMRKMVRFEI